MSEKVVDLKKETQSEIKCFLLSKMNFLKGVFFEKSSRSSFYLDFEEKVWESGHQSVGNDVETAISVSTGSFWGWKVTFEKTLFRLFFLFWPEKVRAFCRRLWWSYWQLISLVSRRTFLEALSRNYHRFFQNLWNLNQSCWILAKTFPKVV